MEKAAIMKDTLDDLINSIYSTVDVSPYLEIILLHLRHHISLYIIDPYLQIKIKNEITYLSLTDNYSLTDHGSYIVISHKDLYKTPFFSKSEFFEAIDKAVEIILNKPETVIDLAALGAEFAKSYLYDLLEKLQSPIKLINFTPSEPFLRTREAFLRHLKEHGMVPRMPHLNRKIR